MSLPPRIEISRADIVTVVRAFYHQMRSHETLGPIFNGHVDDWTAHEDKIVRFWARTILHERDYDGNPMRVHLQAGDVQPAHFAPWLALFEATLQEHLSPDKAAQWLHLAQRIGRGLSMGLDDYQRPPGSVPTLSSAG